MKYILMPFVLLIYFELLGKAFFAFIKRETPKFSFPIGIVLFMAITYCVCWPITAFNGNFFHLLVLYLLLILISVVFILMNIRKMDFNIKWQLLCIFAVLFVFQTYMSYTRTLGEIHGYDSLYYFNTIGFNIGNTELNSLHPHFGTYPNTDIQWITYVFQSFYYFVAIYIYLFNKFFALIGSTFELVPGYVWTFQIILNAFYVGTTLLCIKELKIKNKIVRYALVLLLILFMQNFYWNNALGFIGNNFRMSIHALSTIYLYRYIKENDKVNLYIALMCMLGMCGMSSTGTFATVFLIYGLFFYLYDKEKNIFKIASITLLVPLINIAVVKLGQHLYAVLLPFALCLIVYILNDWLVKLYRNKIIRYGTILLTFIVLYAGSVLISKKFFDISMFLNNYSEVADMSWDYFYFPDLKHYFFNMLLYFMSCIYFYKNKKDLITIVSIVLILTFFNPLCSVFMNTINWVYYRCYDIIINQYTIALFCSFATTLFENKTIRLSLSLMILIISAYLAVVQIPSYWHFTFKPDEDYNYIYKMENKEIEVCLNVREMVNELKIDKPKIIAPNFMMPTFITNGEYLYGKEKRYNWSQYSDITYQLYVIFFPEDGVDNFKPDDYPLYDCTLDYLEKSDYDILVVNYGHYYRNENGKYEPLVSLLNQKYVQTSASTDTYAVYYLK